MPTFRAIRHDCDGGARMLAMAADDLTEEGVVVAVEFSAIGRGDALLTSGLLQQDVPRVILGMDLAGTVLASPDARWGPGDAVLATDHRLGRTHHGGWAERARVPGAWLLAQPRGISPRSAMAIGTAALAAMQAVIALKDHGVAPEAGPVIVTGAAGGVGSLAIVALKDAGFAVTAATGRPHLEGYLRALGATDVISRQTLQPPAVLSSEQWAGAVDSPGGDVLAALIATTSRSGVVAVIGDVSGATMAGNVVILTDRRLTLVGIDAVGPGRSRRLDAWERWASLLTRSPAPALELLVTIVALEHAIKASRALRAGRAPRSRGHRPETQCARP
ncbi:MAG: alcohol dehydrogenase catalytic domain-containing protein [Allosphingosinicella sp.]|uniref:alcohol dehydrogenase catalytic domain-containing protein n=1 Tax=Allosphingosinicella sp. TaxID=2823234 RepID=UPI003924F3EA